MEKAKKKSKLTKTQIIVSVCVALVAALLLGGLVTIFVINFNRTTIGAVKIYDADGQYYFKADFNDNFYGYRFKFEDVALKTVFTFDSDDSLLSIDECNGLVEEHTYQVCACLKGEAEGANSDYGPYKTWTYIRYLASPILSVQEDGVYWPEVRGADFYTLICKNAEGFQIPQILPQEDKSGFVSFELLPVGRYPIQVIACSRRNNVNSSLKPAQTVVDVKESLSAFTNATLSKSKELTFKGAQRVSKIELFVDGRTYILSKFEAVGSPQTGYNYTVNNITQYVQDAVSIKVRPYSESANVQYAEVEIK